MPGRQQKHGGEIRLTSQLTPTNKFTLHFDRQAKGSGPVLTGVCPSAGFISPNTADFDRLITNVGVSDPETGRTYQDPSPSYGAAQGKLTSSLGTRLLVEAGLSVSRTYVLIVQPDGVAVPVAGNVGLAPINQTGLWYSHVNKRDLDTGTNWNATDGFLWKSKRKTFSASMSYVTGSHNVKVGLQNGFGGNPRFYGQEENGHIDRVTYRSGVPNDARVTNHPTFQDPKLNYDIGIYAQDAWTMDRLTLNGGIRLEWLNASVGRQQAPAGRFVPARDFAPIENVPDWFDVRPRFGLAYDLFGDGRTAVKFAIGTFSTPQGIGFAERFNPMDNTDTVNIPWNDADLAGAALATNGDDIVQDNELDLTRIPDDFGVNPLDRFDPDITRENNLEASVNVQHQLMDGVSINLGYFRRQFYDQYSTRNVLRSPSDYRAVQVVSPLNGEEFTAFDLVDSSSISLVDNLVTNAGDGRAETYNGFEVSLQARLPGGGTIISSSTTQRIITKRCDDGDDDPNALRFCDRATCRLCTTASRTVATSSLRSPTRSPTTSI